MCGGVRFEITESLLHAGYCHCTRCQRRTGAAASPQALVARGSLRGVSGEELLSAYEPARGWAKVFCASCGSALWSTDPEDAEVMSVRLGVLDDDPGVRPAWRQFVAYAASWEPIPVDGLPRFRESRSAELQ